MGMRCATQYDSYLSEKKLPLNRRYRITEEGTLDSDQVVHIVLWVLDEMLV